MAMTRCIITVVCAVVLLFSLTGAGENASASPGENISAKLAFASGEKGQYTFDTGVLRGQLLQADKTIGVSSVVHVPSGLRLNGAFGIASYYRVFTTNHRYGTAAWDWPSKSNLLPDGAAQIVWPEEDDRPFQMIAIYRWKNSSTLDIETIVKPSKDLSNFEVFLASYFQEVFPSPCVYVSADPDADGKPGFLTARKPFGDWQMFPRSQEVLPVVHDGRWQKEPNPVKWVIMPSLAAPVCLRRGAATDLVVVLMAPPGDCFAIATPYEGESHYSLYLSLFAIQSPAASTIP